MPDERTRASLRAIGCIIGMLARLADDLERGRPVTAAQLRELAERLLVVHTAAWDRLLTEAPRKGGK